MRRPCNHGVDRFRNRFIDVVFDVDGAMKVERGRLRVVVVEHDGASGCGTL